MQILIVGDIVGSPGRTAFARIVGQMKAAGKVDFVVVNAENAAGGRGITPKLADELFGAGADVITMGDHVWDQKQLIPHIPRDTRILRPLNMRSDCPGRGYVSIQTPHGMVTVVNLVGRTFMQPMDCPFRAMDELLKPGQNLGKVVIVDMHAEATSEKIALGRYLDGKVTAVVGTHTHVQTADECILSGGTGYITDLGMTGPFESVIGRDVKSVLHKFTTGMPSRFEVATGDVRLNGVLLKVDPKTGKTTRIKRVQERIESPGTKG